VLAHAQFGIMRTGQCVYFVLAHDFLKDMATLLANPPLAMLAHSYCSWLAHMHICITRHGQPVFSVLASGVHKGMVNLLAIPSPANLAHPY